MQEIISFFELDPIDNIEWGVKIIQLRSLVEQVSAMQIKEYFIWGIFLF